MKSLILTLLVFLSQGSRAMSVSPMSNEYGLLGDQTSTVYTVSNPSDLPLAIEVSVKGRTTALRGQEISDESLAVKSMFSIFPAATIIQPKQKKGIRVVYVGPKDLRTEKVFRIVISETPTKTDQSGKSAVRMFRKFETTAYVRPKDVSPDLKLISVSDSGSNKLLLKFKNIGTAHQLIRKLAVKIKGDSGSSKIITEQDESSLLTNFLAGEERDIEIRRPDEIKGKALSSVIESME
jgi:P pilus assembly chaperone PapD